MIMSSTRQFNSWAECELAHNLPAASQVLPPRNPVHPPEANGGRLMAATIYMYMLRADTNKPFACSISSACSRGGCRYSTAGE